jgi:hypothetical protein
MDLKGGARFGAVKGILTMKLLHLGLVLGLLACSGEALAQKSVAAETRQAKLRTLAAKLQQRDVVERAQARAFARSAGIPLRRELPNGRVLELQRIAPGIGPVFYITNNSIAADTVSTDEVWPSGSAGLSLSGTGMTIAEWDGGAVYAEHWDLAGRVTQADDASKISGHSTHVAGTLIGAGALLIDTRGMAYTAQLDAYDWNFDSVEMAVAAADGRLISNHSYGVAAGWIYMGGDPPDTWWWIGGSADTDLEDLNFGYYDSESAVWDQIAVDAPYYLIVKAAGNDRFDLGPEPGEEYTIVDQQGEPVATSTLERPADCAPAGYDCLPTHAGAKNILTVGAVDDLPGGYLPIGGPGQVGMTLFSGWGPTDDGRIKPDLVGNGSFLYSAWSLPELYGLAAGTSQATPNVSGSLLLLQQHFENLNGPGQYMRAATLKALAIHSADEAGEAPGPDYAYGWGLLNTQSAAQVISGAGGAHQVVEGSLAGGAVATHAVNVTRPGSVVTATLVWPDPPGSPPAPAVDPPDPMLVNDLDLRVRRGAATWFPWVLDPADPAAAATTGDNVRDNVEQVRVSPADTCSYAVEVSHKNSLFEGAAQDYSLIISVDAPPVPGVLHIDEDFSGGLPAGWSVDTPAGVAWSINTPDPENWRLDNNTGGSGLFAMVDNNTAVTDTSLRTPALDLSAAAAAVLRFSSYYFFDELETIGVEVSTDGGANWVEGWRNPDGNNHPPSRMVVDLTAFIAGQANVMLQFRFNSNGLPQGNLWQIDDVQLEAFEAAADPENLPGPASAPSPADGAAGLAPDSVLAWAAGAQTNSHDVYFGTVNPLGEAQFRGNQADATYDPGPLAADTTYYWRIDEVNANGRLPGCTWSFTTQGEPAEVILQDGFEGG